MSNGKRGKRRRRDRPRRRVREDLFVSRLPIEQYFRLIDQYPLLKREEELILAQRIKRGDKQARRELIRSNLRFVIPLAKRYRNQGLSLRELVDSGIIGLVKAADRFDGLRGYRFISYAVWWIRQTIMQALQDQSDITRPVQINSGDRHPTEALKDTSQIAPDLSQLKRGLRKDVRQSLSSLSEHEALVLIQYFGLSSEDAQTLKMIGDRMGLSRERVRQIKEAALSKLRASQDNPIMMSNY